MFHTDITPQAARLLTQSLPPNSDDIVTSFITNPNDGALNLLETLFNVPSTVVVELRRLRDEYRPPVSLESREKYTESLKALVVSPSFSALLVENYLQTCLEVLSADRQGEKFAGLSQAVGLGFKAARLLRNMTMASVRERYSLSLGVVMRLESGTLSDPTLSKAHQYLQDILERSEDLERGAVSLLLEDQSLHQELYEDMRKSYKSLVARMFNA